MRASKNKSVLSNSKVTALEYLKLSVELVKVLVWPAIVIVAFLMFRQPIEAIIEDMPLKFTEATKVGVGALTFEIQQQAKATGSVELAMRLGKLSPEAIKLLIKTGTNKILLVGEYKGNNGGINDKFTLPTEEELKVLRELEKNGLVDYEENLTIFFSWLQSPLFEVVHSKWDNERISFKPVRTLSPEELDRLKKESYHLSKQGIKAWQAVLNAIFKQLQIPTQSNAIITKPLIRNQQ